jgi:hypothetical protein
MKVTNDMYSRGYAAASAADANMKKSTSTDKESSCVNSAKNDAKKTGYACFYSKTL